MRAARFGLAFGVCLVSVVGMNVATSLGYITVAVGLLVPLLLSIAYMLRVAWKDAKSTNEHSR